MILVSFLSVLVFLSQTWKEITGREIKYMNIDVAKEYELLLKLFKEYKPDTVRMDGGMQGCRDGWTDGSFGDGAAKQDGRVGPTPS